MVSREASQYGILLPHFGEHSKHSQLTDDARRIEELGFSSVWVRDHLDFRPHSFESQDRTFLDPIVVLSSVGAVTSRVTLATGSLILYRHPLHTAALLGSLDAIAGPNRLIVGLGLGTFDHEYRAVGMDGWDRRELLREQVEILRILWNGEQVDYRGHFYQFEGVAVQPSPAKSVPIWYCGTSLAAVRRAVEYCDGWMPGRQPRRDLKKRIERLRRLAEEKGRPQPTVGVLGMVVPGRTQEEALSAIDIPAVVSEASKRYSEPPSGRWESLDDLDGAIIAGTPERIIEEVQQFQDLGVDHFVFDMRTRFDIWRECLELVGEEVLPELSR